ncbi:S1C family serine protease [Arthrobacter sp. CAN_A1]|uniref:S1C family serine protease n=1 Tax=Arthrobacter sp. CAN_A1 TaxID=2787717 RepID=UPI0018CAF307
MTEDNTHGFERNIPPRPQTPPSHSWQDSSRPDDVHSGTPAYDDGSYSSGGFYGSALPPAALPEKRDKKRVGTATLVSGMLVAGLLGGGVVAGVDHFVGEQGVTPASTSQPQSVVVNDTESVNEVTGAAVKASPSVVTIAVSGAGSGGSGSGIVLDDEGHILTNTHVVTLGGQVSDAAVEIRTSDGRVFPAEIVGTDPLSDLAVIKVDAPDLQPATLADSDALNVGDVAIAIGAPLGLSGTVTDGIISTLNRTISVASSAVPEELSDAPAEEEGDGFNFLPPEGTETPQAQPQGSIYLNVIQTDAAINQGNSGGALVDADGSIIGVNVAIASAGSAESTGNIGVGFSIPINYAERVAQEIIADGSASHGFLGVAVSPSASENSDGETSFSVGAEVGEVTEGSPAAAAGLQPGDIITSVAGRPISDPRGLTAAVRMQAEGDTVPVEFQRNGEAQTVDVTVAQAEG